MTPPSACWISCGGICEVQIKDSGPKLKRYATHQIPVYWIVDLRRRVVEVHSQPFGAGKQAGYARTELYQEADFAPVVLDGQEIGRAAVAEMLP